jgi:Flp pilus assembly protein TadG
MMNSWIGLRTLHINNQGNALIETALVVPVLLLMLVGAVDLGRAFTIAVAAQSAAHAGAVYGSLNPTDTAGMIAAAKLDAANWAVIVPSATYDCRCYDGSSVQALCASQPAGCTDPSVFTTENSVYNVTVTTTATVTPLLLYPGFTSFTINSKASLRASR